MALLLLLRVGFKPWLPNLLCSYLSCLLWIPYYSRKLDHFLFQGYSSELQARGMNMPCCSSLLEAFTDTANGLQKARCLASKVANNLPPSHALSFPDLFLWKSHSCVISCLHSFLGFLSLCIISAPLSHSDLELNPKLGVRCSHTDLLPLLFYFISIFITKSRMRNMGVRTKGTEEGEEGAP